jgi:gamma-glutamylcyclotransferase (GGCT)/AIG2-like uncharacterized protein YtfP
MPERKSYTVFICGSALRGQPDHKNLQDAEFLGEAKSIDAYRLHSVKDGWHPGIYEVSSNGVSIPGELYRLSPDQYAYLVSTEPPDMYPADISMEDGCTATAMFYSEHLIKENKWPDISDQGGWVAFKKRTL